MSDKELIELFKKSMEESYKIMLERMQRRNTLNWIYIFFVLFPALLCVLDFVKSLLGE